jgi:hypothetical protein
MYYYKKLDYRLFSMPLFDDLDEDKGVLGFLFRQEIRASKRSFMDKVVHFSILTICFVGLGLVYLLLATPQFKAPFANSIYPKMNAICLDDGPFGGLIAPYIGESVDFVLSDQSCSYSRGQIHVKLTDRDIEKLARNGEWLTDLVQNAQLVPSYRTFGVPILIVVAILIAVGLFSYKIYQEVFPKKHARSQIPNNIVIQYIKGLVRASAVDGQVLDIELQRIRDYVARDLGQNVNPTILRKLAQDLRHEGLIRWQPLTVYRKPSQKICFLASVTSYWPTET